jgi:hypothetical protein
MNWLAQVLYGGPIDLAKPDSGIDLEARSAAYMMGMEAEREACAKVADSYESPCGADASQIAAAIRARK